MTTATTSAKMPEKELYHRSIYGPVIQHCLTYRLVGVNERCDLSLKCTFSIVSSNMVDITGKQPVDWLPHRNTPQHDVPGVSLGNPVSNSICYMTLIYMRCEFQTSTLCGCYNCLPGLYQIVMCQMF